MYRTRWRNESPSLKNGFNRRDTRRAYRSSGTSVMFKGKFHEDFVFSSPFESIVELIRQILKGIDRNVTLPNTASRKAGRHHPMRSWMLKTRR